MVVQVDNAARDLSGMQRAVRWYPPAYDIRVEAVPIPQIIDPDDAIVEVTLAGLCGSDLHIYRGHEDVESDLTCGHEVVGRVVALGASFRPDAAGRPELYSTLHVGDKVVSPFTVSCGECHFCRIGFTCRCVHSCLFGIPTLPGGQAQYIRIPKAGGTLFNLSASRSSSTALANNDLSRLADSSLILLADILPTGVFAAMQALQHPKIAPMLTGKPYPFGGFVPSGSVAQGQAATALQEEDRTLTVGVVGLGPVGVCATVSLLDILAGLETSHGLVFGIIAIDPLESRRTKLQAIYNTIEPSGKGTGRFAVATAEEGKKLAQEWTKGAGCNAVLEVVGNSSALTLAYNIVRPFGIISSVGVHQEPPLPFNGRDVYNKNVSFDFGRCPVRALFPIALEILLKRQDVFGGVGTAASLIDRVVGFDEAVDMYKLFDKGHCGKVLFDPSL
ncbi:chaperonin 10-like protein [Trametes polyzona]|nr:chaperonin 10-like protein [Trametes polyzona]